MAKKQSDKDSSASTSTKAAVMDDLLEKHEEEFTVPQKGDELTATISEITPSRVYFDIDAKTEGVLFGRELERVKDYVDTLEEGQEVPVVVGKPEDPRGQILLNIRNYAEDYAWNFYKEKLDSKEPVTVTGKSANSGGILVEVPFHLTGFIPGSCLAEQWQGKESELEGKKIKAKVIEVDRDQNRLVLSERAVSEAKEIAKEKEVLDEIEIGEQVTGEITRIAPYGLFVTIEKHDITIEGLVHISEVSWQKVDDLEELYEVGEEIDMAVLEVEDNRLQLSLKNLQPDPWETVVKKYPQDKEITGEITKITNYGWLVELEEGVEGLIHVSKIPADRQAEVGDEVKCFIESIDPENRRISLGLVLEKKPVGYR